MWRARRHLADAMAVQLTRYPDAVIGQFARMLPKFHKRQRRLRALGATNVSDAQAAGAPWTKGKVSRVCSSRF